MRQNVSNVHFVVPPSFASEVEALPSRRLGRDYPYWLGGRFNWVAQSYLVLREFREGLTIGTAPCPRRINFGHVMGWQEVGARQGEFRVSVRADYPRLFDVDFEILQNPFVQCGSRQAYLPYWPVPGLIPRDPGRKGLRVLAYAGRIGPRNLAEELKRSPERLLLDLEFHVVSPDRWHDLSQIDLLVAIRSFNKATHDNKPPSKLFSAWRAGIPLIAGYDSAFSVVGNPGEDYIRVSSLNEFRSALERLHYEPEYYAKIVQNGSRRAVEVEHDAIALDWLTLLDGRIAQEFDRWESLNLKNIRTFPRRNVDRGRQALSRAKRSIMKHVSE